MTDEDRYGGFTPRRATKFYIPLLLQAFSQSLTYPLVAAIVTHGAFGVDALTGFAQGQIAMFMIGSLGGGLVMTGMVFARTKGGYLCFRRLNTLMMVALLSIQVLLALPPFDRFIFSHFLNLPPNLYDIARQTMLWGVFMQGAFFLRNVPLVALFNARASFEANLATLVRFVLTAACPLFFIPWDLTGPMWGLTATTIPCIIEYLLTHVFARKYVRELPLHTADRSPHRVMDQFRFTVPLSLGGFLLAMSPFMVAAFVGRSMDAVAMLAIHYVTMGLANPVAYGALRMQAVAIQFPPEYKGDRRMLHYAVYAGLVLGIVPLVFTLPQTGGWYFRVVQNVPEANVWMARTLIGVFALWPVLQAVRGRAEGLAAWQKRPRVVLLGQFVHLATLVATLALALHFGEPGWLMGATAIFAATLATIAAIQLALRRA